MSRQQRFPSASSRPEQRPEVIALLVALEGPESGPRVWGERLSVPPSTHTRPSNEWGLQLSPPPPPGHVCHGHGPAYGVMLPWGIRKVQSSSGEEAGPLPEVLDDWG